MFIVKLSRGFTVAPEIQNFPMVIAKEGEDAELICAATGFPAPKFVWFKVIAFI